MDLLLHFRRLFSYNVWANREVIANLRAAGNPPTKSMTLISHIIAAETVWIERIEGKKQSVAVWPQFSIDECADRAADLARRWNEFLGALGEDGFTRPVTYKNTVGAEWTSNVIDILTHVTMHGTYHRGQIALDVRNAGQSPAYTDYIHPVRTKIIE